MWHPSFEPPAFPLTQRVGGLAQDGDSRQQDGGLVKRSERYV